MGDLIDKGLAIGAGFDWISPMISIVGELVNGGGHGFVIDHASCPMSGHQVGRLLRKRGVRAWGLMIVSGKLLVSVPKDRARWAQHILEQAGIPIENPLPAGQGQAPQGRRAPRKQRPIQERSQILRRLGGR